MDEGKRKMLLGEINGILASTPYSYGAEFTYMKVPLTGSVNDLYPEEKVLEIIIGNLTKLKEILKRESAINSDAQSELSKLQTAINAFRYLVGTNPTP